MSKVCVYVGYGETGCGRGIEPHDYGESFGIAEHVARWSAWRLLPRPAQCFRCVEHLDTKTGRKRLEPFRGETTHASRDQELAVSLLCAALAGSWTADMRALLVDPDGVPVLLDLAEQCLGVWPVVACEWPVVERHEHVWLKWRSGDRARATRDCAIPGDLDWIRRCPCGVFEHEDRRTSDPNESIVPEWDACSACGSPRHPDSRRHCGAPACIEHVGDDCHDRNCQREAGHGGPHMSRTWDSWNTQEIVDEWGDIEPAASAAP